MKSAIECVKAFHVAMKVDNKQRLRKGQLHVLQTIGRDLLDHSKALELLCDHEDKRLLRAHLLIEELGETLIAMGGGRELDTLDGLTDLLYVLIGAAITFDLPLCEAFNEVHSSNMTKSATGPRLRDKGSNYRPPQLAKVLKEYRECEKQ